MAQVIKTKNSDVKGRVPTSLQKGELAVNLTDKKLFVGTGSDVVEVSSSGGGATVLIGSEQAFPVMPEGKTPGDTWLPKNGKEYARLAYPALWEWAEKCGLVVSEAEWQVLAGKSHGGAVSVYSSGDGTTSFRVPSTGTDELGIFQRAAFNDAYMTGADKYRIAYADTYKSHTHGIDHDHPSANTSSDSHTHGYSRLNNWATVVNQGTAWPDTLSVPESGWSAYGKIAGHSGTAMGMRFHNTKTAVTASDSHTHSVNLPAYTGASGSSGSTETTPKYQFIQMWIYSGNEYANLPAPAPDWLQQQTVNTSSINSLKSAVEEIKAYPTPWEDIKSKLKDGATCNAGELLARWEDESTYRVAGIIRFSPGKGSGTYLVMPFGSSAGHQYRPVSSSITTATGDNGYCELSDSVDLKFSLPATSSWIMMDATFIKGVVITPPSL